MAYDKEADPVSTDLLILQRARDVLARGWCQNALANRDGGHCVIGAVNVAMTGRCALYGDDGAYNKRTDLLCLVGFEPGTAVQWNNHPSRTQAEVLARFDEAIHRLSNGKGF